jgi:hypothetical protein
VAPNKSTALPYPHGPKSLHVLPWPQLFEQVSLVLVYISRKTHLRASFRFSTVHVVRSLRTDTTFVTGTVQGTADLGVFTLLFVDPARRAAGAAG